MLVLYQAEWCPHSHRVRMRLTELGLEWNARPVSVDRSTRDEMDATGTRSIPTLVHDETVVSGADAIIDYLDEHYPEPPDAFRHAEKLKTEEWQHWLELHGPG